MRVIVGITITTRTNAADGLICKYIHRCHNQYMITCTNITITNMLEILIKMQALTANSVDQLLFAH